MESQSELVTKTDLKAALDAAMRLRTIGSRAGWMSLSSGSPTA